MSNPAADAVVSITLPTGDKLVASPTLRTQSNACSAASRLQMQLAPWVASMTCQLAVLKLLKPLIVIVQRLPAPPPNAIEEFMEAAAEVQPCFAAATPAGVLPFVRELLCLSIQSLGCLRRNLQTIAQLSSAGAVTPAEVSSVVGSYQPITSLLELASGLFAIAGITVPHAPQLAPGLDTAALAQDDAIVAAFAATLQTLVDALGGCVWRERD